MRAWWLVLLACGGCPRPPDAYVDTRCQGVPVRGCLSDGQDGYYSCVTGLYREHLCDVGAVCSDGMCAAVVCTPGFFFCDGEVADSCDGTGAKETRTDCGADGKHCVVGPLMVTCEAQACKPSATYCAPDGSAVLKCGPDGQSMQTVQTCDRGASCVGASCVDRCTVAETQSRTTLGCRFVGAALAPGAPTVLVANPQPDLPATVTLRSGTAAPVTRTIVKGGTAQIAWTAPLGGSALEVTATQPIYAWLVDGTQTVVLHPEHALSTSYLVGLDGALDQRFAVAATIDGTTVTSPSTATLARGAVLMTSPADWTGMRIEASAPVAVQVASSAGEVTLPGADALGLDVRTPEPALVVARDAATVTTDKDGTLTLAAGASARVQGEQWLRASAPILVVAGARVAVPALDEWEASAFAAWPGGGAADLVLVTANGISTAPATVGAIAPGGPFFGVVRGGASRVPLAYGLRVLH
jgi:hypothetical protein